MKEDDKRTVWWVMGIAVLILGGLTIFFGERCASYCGIDTPGEYREVPPERAPE